MIKLIYHTLIRSLSLVAIGLLIMNGRKVDPEATGMAYAAWNVLMFTGVILLWNLYPKAEGRRKIIFSVLKWTGLALLIFLLAIYRRNVDGDIVWINPKNWSILGGIGWSYLSVGLLYFLCRGRFWGLALSFILLVALNVTVKAGYADFIREIPRYFWPVGSGSTASIVMAGVLLTKLFIKDEVASSIKGKFIWGIGFGTILFLAGWLLMPFGLAKIGSTPSWCLYSAGICVVIFMSLYWIVDIHKVAKWANFMKPAGSNPLLTYLLPDVYYAFKIYHFIPGTRTGWAGVIWSLCFALFILGVSAVFTRYKVRLQL